MQRGMLAVLAVVMGCGEPTITDPCPGKITCPDETCCPTGYPYSCGTQCYTAPCGTEQITCVNVSRTDGCYGGTWEGTYVGGGSGGTVRFDIRDHVITATQPVAGTGTIDCDTGVGHWMSSGGSTYSFQGTWMHTSSRGDRISGSTFTSPGGNGTWTALRVE